ncbi:hypothetical protein [Phenylobacterium sp.]|uniref:hypothetical protein n=1 Tax=Phenylobacterium sp. TaxID=1871053 RepID=UPI002B83CE43|nr:hypothetical protein [Phenylobacterium sp.]HLZ74577.1 hypothetical protein [Phenylobacterium sp.]
MDTADFECPACGETAVTLYPGGEGDLLAACQGCGREHGAWRDCVAAAAPKPHRAWRPAWASWFLKDAPH